MVTLPCPETTMVEQRAPFQALEAEGSKGIRVEKVSTDRSGKKTFVLVKEVEEKRGDQ